MKATNIIHLTIAIATITIGFNTYAMTSRVPEISLEQLYALVDPSKTMVMSNNTAQERLRKLAKTVQNKVMSRKASEEKSARIIAQKKMHHPLGAKEIEDNEREFANFRQETALLEDYYQVLNAAYYLAIAGHLSETTITQEIFQKKPFLVVHFLQGMELTQQTRNNLIADQTKTVKAVLPREYQSAPSATVPLTDKQYFEKHLGPNCLD